MGVIDSWVFIFHWLVGSLPHPLPPSNVMRGGGKWWGSFFLSLSDKTLKDVRPLLVDVKIAPSPPAP